MPTDTIILDLKRQWLALDAENDKRGKIRLLRSLDLHGPEMGALTELMIGLHFTEPVYRDVGTFQREREMAR